MALVADGVSVPIPPMAGTGSGFAGTGTYVCEGDTMTINNNRVTTPFIMVRVV